MAEYRKEYRRKHRAKLVNHSRRYYREHKDELARKARAKRVRHPVKARRIRLRSYAKHRRERHIGNRRYYRRHAKEIANRRRQAYQGKHWLEKLSKRVRRRMFWDHVRKLEKASYRRCRRKIANWKKLDRKRHPEKAFAERVLRIAVKYGVVKKPQSCSICKKRPPRKSLVHGHHEDYSRPLDVIWCCHQCHADLHSSRRLPKFMRNSRRCTRCRLFKPRRQFSRHKLGARGLKSWCKQCVREHGRLHYKRNRRRLRSQHQAYYRGHRQECNARSARNAVIHRDRYEPARKAWYEKNWRRLMLDRRRRYAHNRIALQRWTQEYYERHPELRRLCNRKYAEKHPLRVLAGSLLRTAVSRGVIKKPKRCSKCRKLVRKDLLHGHHDNYLKPYHVRWLCPKCHSRLSPKRRRAVRP